jgi:hypothetical protein
LVGSIKEFSNIHNCVVNLFSLGINIFLKLSKIAANVNAGPEDNPNEGDLI